MTRPVLIGLLLAGVSGTLAGTAVAQQGQRPQSPANRDYVHNKQESDSDESWEEWFSSWWSDDNESRALSGDGANSGRWGVQGFLKRHDTDGDGSLSRDELPALMRAGFETLDRDDDNVISRRELQAHAAKHQSSRTTPVAVTYIWVIDVDQGRASLQELQQAYDLLQKADQNEDGRITRSELRQRQRELVSQWVDHCFEKLDEDDDGRITLAEAEDSALARRYDRLDRNQDDELTRSELMTAVQPASGQERNTSARSNSSNRGQIRPASAESTSNDDQDE